jgi:hypothetical protein
MHFCGREDLLWKSDSGSGTFIGIILVLRAFVFCHGFHGLSLAQSQQLHERRSSDLLFPYDYVRERIGRFMIHFARDSVPGNHLRHSLFDHRGIYVWQNVKPSRLKFAENVME